MQLEVAILAAGAKGRAHLPLAAAGTCF